MVIFYKIIIPENNFNNYLEISISNRNIFLLSELFQIKIRKTCKIKVQEKHTLVIWEIIRFYNPKRYYECLEDVYNDYIYP